jgi:hypothetical protein
MLYLFSEGQWRPEGLGDAVIDNRAMRSERLD